MPSYNTFTVMRSHIEKGNQIKFKQKSIQSSVYSEDELFIDKNGALMRTCFNHLVPLSRLISRFKIATMRSYSVFNKKHHLNESLLGNSINNKFRMFFSTVLDAEPLGNLANIYSSVYEAEMIF